MRVVFMGTPEFAVNTLEALINSRHEVLVVVTGVDKPAGRSLKIKESAVKICAKKYNLSILQPPNLKALSFERSLAKFKPDIGVVVAFRILPESVINISRLGCVNLHPSLLPALRGAAPINWALINGFTETGVTVFQIRREVDSGGILLQEKTGISEDDNAGTLSDLLSKRGADLIVQALDGIEDGSIKPFAQSGEVTKAPRIDNELRKINWHWSAVRVHNLVRGLTPYPGALTILNKKIIKVSKTNPALDICSGKPGEIRITNKGEFFVSTSEGCLRIIELQLEGKKRMSASEFLRGHQIQSGTMLG
ncbi:methionyl-tRNA formyltransferase [bacterium]|nr:methionyl-tRNA formyltransferase [bacterium]